MARRNASLGPGVLSVVRLSSFVFRRFFSVLLFVLLTFPLLTAPAQAYSRIISLKPNITEILFALGVGDRIVGATQYCTRPPAAEKIPRVADYIQVNSERVLELKPDLILGSKENSSQKEIHFLMDRGIPVELLSFSTLEETLASIQKIGKILGKEEAASKVTRKMKSELAQLKLRAQAVPTKRALFLVGYEPLVVVGGNNFIHEATAYLGVQNVVGKSQIKYPTFSTEQLIRAAPEIIIDLSMGTESSKEKQDQRQEWWQRFPSIPAVRNHQVLNFDIEKIRAVPDLPQALGELFQIIHGT